MYISGDCTNRFRQREALERIPPWGIRRLTRHASFADVAREEAVGSYTKRPHLAREGPGES
jgi:hypothetical protein